MIPFVDLKPQYKYLKSEIDRRIFQVLEHHQFINGPEVLELEEKLAHFVGTRYALTCASGTDALLLPLMALGVGPGDEVITTSFSFIATAEVICLLGATPVFVDIDPLTYNLDITQVEKAITTKTKVILPVSLYGQTPDLEALETLAQKHQLYLIEDGAQSFGAMFKKRRSGSFGTAGTTSFFPAKPLGCYGDGGAVFTDNQALYQAMKEIREHGSERRYYHTRLGLNARLDTLQCAILLAKLERYPLEIEMRNQVAHRYQEAFRPYQSEDFRLPFVSPQCLSVWAQYTIEISHRDEFQKQLAQRGVSTAVHYPLIMPDQPWYQKHISFQRSFPIAQNVAKRVLSLPFYADLTPEIQDQIIEQVIQCLKK